MPASLYRQTTRMLAALMALFFVLYCSVGVCTNWLQTSQSDRGMAQMEMMDHSQHQGTHAGHHAEGKQPAPDNAHCGGDTNGCEWSRNLAVDPTQDADPAHSFFLLYFLAASLVLALLWRQVRLVGPYVRQHFFLRSYPRLHLQHAVFLN